MEDMLIVLIAVFLMLISHAAAVYAGWVMGCTKNGGYHPVKKIKPHEPQEDELDAERLDWR